MDCVPELPLRERAWGDARVMIGNGAVSAALKDAFTDREVAIDEAQGARSLRVASALSEFPAAVLSA